MTDTDFGLDDESVLTAEGEVAAAICGHQVVMQRGDALTADMLDEFHGFPGAADISKMAHSIDSVDG